MTIKKLTKVFGVVTFGVLLFSQNIFASAFGNVNVASLNVRAGANTNQKIMGSIGPTDYIHILNKADDGWYAVETETDLLGYVSGQYIDIQKAKGIVNANSVNIRSGADYNAPVVSQVYKNNVIYAYAQIGDWYLIKNNLDDAYIHREFLNGLLIDQLPNKKAAAPKAAKPDEKTIAAVTTTLNLRSEPSTDSQILKKIGPATVVAVDHISDEWAKVRTEDNEQGFLAKDYLNIGKESAKDELLKDIKQSSKEASSQNSAKGNDIVSYAKQFLGNPYVFGGNSLTNGVDCSGFTSQICKQFGVSLSRSSSAQYANNGVHVDPSDARPGDLFFYGHNGKVSHVALYIGNGEVIQASTAKTGIITGTAFRTSGKPLIGVKRVF